MANVGGAVALLVVERDVGIHPGVEVMAQQLGPDRGLVEIVVVLGMAAVDPAMDAGNGLPARAGHVHQLAVADA